jgi:chromosome segregation ATPase|tara:strand:- start:650 stop:1087 length:438 start_codon:yes stop_codon:yes gene_type:complete
LSYVTTDAFVNEISSINRNILTNINRIQNNREVIDLHSEQLVKAGNDLTYFGEKVQELDATNQAQYENINELYLNHADQETRLNQAKSERDSIQQKLNTHSHSNGNGCGMFDIPCHLRNLTGQIGTVALIAGGAYVGYQILKRKK